MRHITERLLPIIAVTALLTACSSPPSTMSSDATAVNDDNHEIFEALQQIVALRQEMVTHLKTALLTGQATEVDVINAEIEYLEARIRLLTARGINKRDVTKGPRQ